MVVVSLEELIRMSDITRRSCFDMIRSSKMKIHATADQFLDGYVVKKQHGRRVAL